MNGISSVNGSNFNYGQIASGKKINSAADDAANLAIANKLESQSNGLNVGASNAKDGIGVLNIADGALSGISDYLQEIKDISLKASNSFMYTASDLGAMQKQVDEYMKGIEQLAVGTEYNTMKVLDGSMADMHIATNPDGTGMKIGIASSTLEALGIEGYNITGDFDMSAIDKALEKVSNARGDVGAQTNRLEYSYTYGKNAALEQTGAQSRLEDLDMPAAISEKKKNEVIDEYKTNMLKAKMEQESLVTKILQ